VRLQKVEPSGEHAELARALADLERVDLWVDPESWLPLKRARLLPLLRNLTVTFPLEFEFRDYRLVNGVPVPHIIRESVRGQLFREFRIDSAQVNTGLSASMLEAGR
jgi:hypothetical protein